MSKRIMILLLCAAVFSSAAFSDPIRIAVGDFKVTSDNTRLKYVGKGFAEMIAAELAISRAVTLIDRDRRAAILGEMEFSLSGAADAESQARIGKLLSADYLMFGEIVDMDTQILITCRIVRVETGDVAWTDKVLGLLSDYDAVSKKLASSALKELGGETAVAAVQQPAPKAEPEKQEEAIIAFSKAVDSYDKKDSDEARKQIAVARAIDPTNPAVGIYFDKLAAGSPRFQVELDRYAPSYNPALLGFIDKGSVYSWSDVMPPWANYLLPFFGDYQVDETKFTVRWGVNLPLGEAFGLSTELSWNGGGSTIIDNSGAAVIAGYPENAITSHVTGYGASVGAGLRLTDNWSIGLTGRFDYLVPNKLDNTSFLYVGDILSGTVGPFMGASLGFAGRTSDGNLSGDAQVIWSNQPNPYADLSSAPGVLVMDVMPLIIASNITAAFLEKSLFANLSAIGEIYIGSLSQMVFRGIPGVEWWPTKWIALRAAGDFSYLAYAGSGILGYGFMAGLSLALGAFDIDINFVDRMKLFRLTAGWSHQGDQTFLLGFSWNGFMERK